jgi:hypothetical protein
MDKPVIKEVWHVTEKLEKVIHDKVVSFGNPVQIKGLLDCMDGFIDFRVCVKGDLSSALKQLRELGVVEPNENSGFITWIDPDINPYNKPATPEQIAARDEFRGRMTAMVEKHTGKPCVAYDVQREGFEAEWVAWCQARGQKLPIDDVPRLLRPTWRKVAYKFLKAGGKGLGPKAIDDTAVWLYKASLTKFWNEDVPDGTKPVSYTTEEHRERLKSMGVAV